MYAHSQQLSLAKMRISISANNEVASGDRDWRVRCPFMSLTTHSVRIGVNWGPQNADELQVTQPDFTLGSLYMVLPQPPLT